MASVKIILRKEKKQDGTYPLAIRITKDRRSSYIYLNYSVTLQEWDKRAQRVKKTHPNHVRLNNYLIKKLSEATDKAIELETHKSDVSSKAVRKKLLPSAGSTFFPQATLYLETIRKAGKYNRYSSESPRIAHFREFLSGEDIAFSEITVPLLERFKAFLKDTRKISNRTIMNHLVVIRSVISQAIKDNVADAKYYPFGRGKIQIKFPKTHKIGLEVNEVQIIEQLEIENPSQQHTRNVWLVSFYFAGMRASDTLQLKWLNIQNERLYYTMGKNDKSLSLKIPEKALKILQQYRRENPIHDLIFPDLETLPDLDDMFAVQRRIKTRIKRHDINLEKIAEMVAEKTGVKKKISMHISRHTFGNISGDKIPIQMLQRLYMHSSVITTIGYQANFMHKSTDEALDAVVGF